MKLFISILFASIGLVTLTFAQTPPKADGPPQNVKTQFGWVQGTKQDKVYQFLGIPFAKPPVGTMRWKAPESPDVWNDTLLTKKYAPACPQKKRLFETARLEDGELKMDVAYEGDEDCLYLNVWTPVSAVKKPVMVFIHGGGNHQGSTSLNVYNGKLLAERGDVVLVTIAYRVGPLGFMTYSGLEAENENRVSGNYGTLDQILALRWVKNNIEAFGGDPNNVTLFGESAGSLNTANLLVSPLAKGLFHKAIMQSGSPFVDKNEVAKNKALPLIQSCGCASDNPQETIACMRRLSAEELYNRMPELEGNVETRLTQWMPNLDGYVFLDYANNVIRQRLHHQMPMIIGTNTNEGILFAPWGKRPEDLTAYIDQLPMPDSLKRKAKQMYPAGLTKLSTWTALGDLLGDMYFQTSALMTVRSLSQNQEAPVYRYIFDHELPGPAKWLKSLHGLELIYIFQYPFDNKYGKKHPLNREDLELQKIMLRYWTNFAKTGNPNDSTLPVWKIYDANQDNYLELSPKPREKYKFRASYLQLWEEAKALLFN